MFGLHQALDMKYGLYLQEAKAMNPIQQNRLHAKLELQTPEILSRAAKHTLSLDRPSDSRSDMGCDVHLLEVLRRTAAKARVVSNREQVRFRRLFVR